MMDKKKTLKDLQNYYEELQVHEDDIIKVTFSKAAVDILRQEAIKWIKALPIWCKTCKTKAETTWEGEIECPKWRKDLERDGDVSNKKAWDKHYDHYNNSVNGDWGDLGKCDVLMEFFNIKEKEIK